MIENERQYEVTKAAISRFEQELSQLDALSADLPPQIRAAQRAGVEDQVRKLSEDARTYERTQAWQFAHDTGART